MYTQPQISTNGDLNSRSFIYFYYDNKRYKIYNGNKLNLPIFPNHAKTIKQRNTLLKQLQFEFHKALSNNWNPNIVVETNENIDTKSCFLQILNEKLNSPYSKTYKRDLQKICSQYLEFLKPVLLEREIKDIPSNTIEQFLNQFKSSGRHYMNKRRMLCIFYSEVVRKGYLEKNPIATTAKQKTKAKLHEIYPEQQLKNVLEFLKEENYNLYLCALITYGCLLRPHQEIRGLKRKHINEDFTQILLSGGENKSGRIRTVFIPPYLQLELKKQLSAVTDMETNIFTLDNQITFNDDYFKTQWSRAKRKMLKQNLVLENQTLYSFRHTAVVNVYRKTKDLQIIQQLLQHSNMIVTLNYLRGLGEISNENLIQSMPTL
ncbi:site-specific integrase [Pedobacter sp. ASV1-7]|uniref:tyrosine-type recombinase/integrase n=1 Tax=Pedobacter sp. ASV1-7 TaxID=3145237 RepID=UPI0032E91EC6